MALSLEAKFLVPTKKRVKGKVETYVSVVNTHATIVISYYLNVSMNV